MDTFGLELNHASKTYLDEKELFILYSLMRNGYVNNNSGVFDASGKGYFHFPPEADTPKKKEKALGEYMMRVHENAEAREHSPTVLSYLLKIGKQLDEKHYKLFVRAEYSLHEGGFLSEWQQEIMIDYLKDTAKHRKTAKKYRVLNSQQLAFLNDCIKYKKWDSLKLGILANQPIEEYREAIQNKKGEPRFIELVNKLIHPDREPDGFWETDDAKEFLEIYYAHNKKMMQESMAQGKGFFHHDDWQTKLAKLIFAHVEITLCIKNSKVLEKYLADYLNLFINDQLNGQTRFGLTGHYFSPSLLVPPHPKLFGFQKQKEILVNHTKAEFQKFQRPDLELGSPFFKPNYIGDRTSKTVAINFAESEEEELFLFVHTAIALAYRKEFQVKDLYFGHEHLFDLYDRGFVFKILWKPEATSKTIKESKKESIKSITFITRPDRKSYNFYVNDNIKDTRLLRGDSFRILELIKIIKNEEDVPFSKDIQDYVNSNKACAIYCAGKYDLTRILERHGNFLRIASDIKAKVISQKSYKAVKNKTKST